MGVTLSKDVVAVPLAAWCLYALASFFSPTRKLEHIPSIGHSNLLLSYWSALQFLYDPPGYLRREWAKIPPGTKFVKVPSLTRWVVLSAVSEMYRHIANAPEHSLSVDKASEEFLQGDHTLHFKEIGDNLQIPVIRTLLNRSLGDLVPEVHEEVVLAFEESFPLKGDDWQSFEVTPEFVRIVARISNRVLVGLPLCRNKDYISANTKYAVEVFVESYALCILPRFLRQLAHDLLSPIPGRVKQMTEWTQPLIDLHRKKRAEYGPDYDEPNIFLNWLADVAEEHDRPDRDAILRLMGTNFGSMHTTTITFTHALYSLLSRPEYIEHLRDEVDQCVQDEGWTKAAMDKMRLLDSFIKESHRVDFVTPIIGQRLAVEDLNLAGVHIPKGTMVGANMQDGHFSPSTWGDNADEFDGFRFVKIEEETGKKIQIVSTSVNTLTFGHGRHACPGRFFAAQEKKLMLAHLLHTYDMKFDSKDGARPKNMWVGLGCVPNRDVRIMLRRRTRD